MISDGPLDPEIVAEFRDRGQGHVFRFLPDLAPAEAETLLSQARSIDLELLSRLCRDTDGPAADFPTLAPLEPVRADSSDAPAAREEGVELLSSGRVAFYTVAGGQGTRLGYDGPKGCYPVATSSNRPLFAWHAEKLLAASRRYGTSFPWAILVSDANAEATRDHFVANDWYGLAKHIRFVRQKMLPAVDDTGRILLCARDRIALSPNGHGGSIDALADHGALDWFRELKVEVVSYFQVDNPLLNVADPFFLGFHRLTGAEMGVKVVRKSHPLEKAGVVAMLGDRPGIVEYSELPEDLAHARDGDGELLYGLANIAAHTLSVPFLERMAGMGLPWHVARKLVPTIDEQGAPVEVEGRKFETFIFDAIPRAAAFFAYLVDRMEDFAPLKNSEGDDSPASVVEAIEERTRSWFARAGAPLPDGREVPEITPQTAYDFETFCEALPALARKHRL